MVPLLVGLLYRVLCYAFKCVLQVGDGVLGLGGLGRGGDTGVRVGVGWGR